MFKISVMLKKSCLNFAVGVKEKASRKKHVWVGGSWHVWSEKWVAELVVGSLEVGGNTCIFFLKLQGNGLENNTS